jgi:hypothetical protein
MLKISTDGRKAVLDMRLINGQPAAGQRKLDVAAPAHLTTSTRRMTRKSVNELGKATT